MQTFIDNKGIAKEKRLKKIMQQHILPFGNQDRLDKNYKTEI